MHPKRFEDPLIFSSFPVFRVQTVWRQGRIYFSCKHMRALISAKLGFGTLIERDHLGDWSPEKDCC